MRKVIVVGGGAAGLMAAVSAAQNGAEVMLLEKNNRLAKRGADYSATPLCQQEKSLRIRFFRNKSSDVDSAYRRL